MAKKLQNKKAQMFTWDVVTATMLFLIIMAILILVWVDTVSKIAYSEMSQEIAWLSTSVSEQLVRTPGQPANWTDKPELSDIKVFGLSDYDTYGDKRYGLNRVIDADKVLHFINISEKDYMKTREKLFGTGKYDYYFEISCLKEHDLDCFNGLVTESINWSTIKCANDETFYVENGTISSDLNLTGAWHFDEASGDKAYDSSAKPVDGSVKGAAWTEGRYSYGLGFDGINDYVSVNNDSKLSPQNRVTVSAWIRSPGVNKAYGTVVSAYRQQAPAGTAYTLRFSDRTGKTSFGTTTTTETYVVDDAPLKNDTWYHVTGVYDGSNMILYINGVPKKTVPKTGTLSSQENISIGAATIGSSLTNYFYGTIDDVRIWSRALTAQEIKKNYETEKRYCIIGKSVETGKTSTMTYDTKTATFSQKIGADEDNEAQGRTVRIKLVVYKAVEE